MLADCGSPEGIEYYKGPTMTKRTLVILMIGVNVVLATTLGLMTFDLPRANAQVAPMGGNYVMVSAEETENYDALYVLDLSTRILNVFEVDRSSQQIIAVDQRDLTQDFREDKRSRP